jgi:hypothetical protein
VKQNQAEQGQVKQENIPAVELADEQGDLEENKLRDSLKRPIFKLERMQFISKTDLKKTIFGKGRLEIGKPAHMVPTYLVLSGKKSARSPPAEFFNSKNHAKTMQKPC